MRTLREAIDSDSTLFKKWKWSEWYPLMAPGTLRNLSEQWEDRCNKPGVRIKVAIIRQLFPKKTFRYTVYEIMMMRGAVEVPVYFGLTRECVSAIFDKHCSGDSHLGKLIDRALSADYQLCFRAKRKERGPPDDYKDDARSADDSDDDTSSADDSEDDACSSDDSEDDACSADDCEDDACSPDDCKDDALTKYDFAWNKKNNANKREIITKSYTGNSSVRIKREKVHGYSLIDSWQWSKWRCIMKPVCPDEDDEAWAIRKTTGEKLTESQIRMLFPTHFIEHHGIFELMVEKDDHAVTVFVDSSFGNETGQCQLAKELVKYCDGESEKEDLIIDALLAGYSVYARVKPSEPDTGENAKADANVLLDQYDYAWNIERNAVRNIYLRR